MNKKEKNIRQELIIEAGKYVLDLTKLVFAGIVLVGIFNLNADKLNLVLVGIMAICISTLFGFLLLYYGKHYK